MVFYIWVVYLHVCVPADSSGLCWIYWNCHRLSCERVANAIHHRTVYPDPQGFLKICLFIHSLFVCLFCVLTCVKVPAKTSRRRPWTLKYRWCELQDMNIGGNV